MAWAAPASQVTGDLITAAIWNQNVVDNPIALTATGLQFLIDGGGAAITTGIKMDLIVPAKCTANSWTVLLDQSGSIQFDLWKDTYANYPPTVADTITGTDKPLVAAATKGTSSALTGWTTAWSEGDTIRVNVDSITTATRALCYIDLAYS